MEYNLSSLRTRVVIDKLDDEEFEPQVVDNFINDTQRDIFNQFELTFMEKIFSGVVAPGSTMFAMPADLAQVQSQVITSPEGSTEDMKNGYIPFRTFNTMFPTPQANKPSSIGYWTLYGGNVLTSAPTDKEYTMTLFYVKKPQLLLQDTDVPEIPEEFAEILVLGALMRIQRRNEDYDLARETEGEYNKLLMQMVNRYGAHREGPVKMKNQQIRG